VTPFPSLSLDVSWTGHEGGSQVSRYLDICVSRARGRGNVFVAEADTGSEAKTFTRGMVNA
jgi:hypothetical protein